MWKNLHKGVKGSDFLGGDYKDLFYNVWILKSRHYFDKERNIYFNLLYFVWKKRWLFFQPIHHFSITVHTCISGLQSNKSCPNSIKEWLTDNSPLRLRNGWGGHTDRLCDLRSFPLLYSLTNSIHLAHLQETEGNFKAILFFSDMFNFSIYAPSERVF